MKLNPYIMRGYDIRGVVGEDLNPEIVEHFGKAYGTYCRRELNVKKIVVGRDSRLTSEEYKNALVKGIVSTGVDVVDVGLSL